ncbi:MAG: hypothetical protein SH809_19090 [Rhodothermales bacterium]|nr:hypothetical protein [Rhodothermales bacterium]
MSTEAYSATGINGRRPGNSGSVFGAATASATDITYGLNFHLSTEDDRLRQSMNRFALSASGERLQATVGDVSPVFSRFSLNGATIRGAYVDYRPAWWVASILAGRSQRAIDTGIGAAIRRPANNRSLLSARVGVGAESRHFFHLIGLIARDDPDSGDPSFRAAPVENVSLTPTFGLHFLERRLSVSGELTASAFTQDTRAARATDDGAPGMLGFFTPRVGSRFDYAGLIETRYTHSAFADTSVFDQITVLASYERVQPGFVSLGRPYTRSDQAVFRLQPQARLLDRRLLLGLDITTRRNNLGDTRNATLQRNQLHLTSQAQLSPALFLHAGYLWMANANNPVFDDPASHFLKQRIVSQTLLLSPVLTVPIEPLTHRFALTLAVQNLADRTDRQDALDRRPVNFNNLTSTLSHAVILPSGLSINSGLSRISSKAPTTDVRAMSLNAGLSAGLFEGKMNAGFNASVSTTRLMFDPPAGADPDTAREQETSRQYGLTLTGTYRVTGRDILRLNVRGFTTRQPLRGNFQEIQSTLRFEHKF